MLNFGWGPIILQVLHSQSLFHLSYTDIFVPTPEKGLSFPYLFCRRPILGAWTLLYGNMGLLKQQHSVLWSGLQLIASDLYKKLAFCLSCQSNGSPVPCLKIPVSRRQSQIRERELRQTLRIFIYVNANSSNPRHKFPSKVEIIARTGKQQSNRKGATDGNKNEHDLQLITNSMKF